MENKQANVLGVSVELGVSMAMWAFARQNPTKDEIEAFFDGNKRRLLEQKLDPTAIEETIEHFKNGIKSIKELYAKDKH